MPTTIPGRASYKAYRLFGLVTLVATGETPNFNDKVDIVQLPFRRFPPIYGLVFIQQDIRLPAMRPFVYEERIVYPEGFPAISVHDADGPHEVPIADVQIPPMAMAASAEAESGAGFCVFNWLGRPDLLIAPCDALLPAVYRRVYGPATMADCERYVAQNGGR
jgi:hypothetical protein